MTPIRDSQGVDISSIPLVGADMGQIQSAPQQMQVQPQQMQQSLTSAIPGKMPNVAAGQATGKQDSQDFNLKAYLPILATAYGEGANQSPEAKREILSTILNRAESGKKEFGADTGKITDVLRKGYYAYSNNTPRFQEAMNQSFKDPVSENSFKEFVSLFSGMMKGNIPRSDSVFFLTPKEAAKIAQQNKEGNYRQLDLSKLERTSQTGAWDFYKYKSSSRGRKKSR